MTDYTVNFSKKVTVTWKGSDGQDQTRTFVPGESITFTDACESGRFVRASISEAGTGYTAQDENSNLSAMDATCNNQPTPQTVTQTTDEPELAANSVPAEPGSDTTTEPPQSNPPESPTNPTAVEAPQPEGNITTGNSTLPGLPQNGIPIEQQAHSPENPNPPAQTAESSTNPDTTPEQVQRNDPTPGLPHYEFGLNNDPTQHQSADPVDIFSGTYGLMETDFDIPGRRFPLQLIRRYRSGIPYFGTWGFNWDHNHNSYVRPLDNNYVAVWTGLMNEDVYEPQPDNTWLPPLGVLNALEHKPASLMNAEQYIITRPDGTEFVYERPDGWPLMDRLPLVYLQDRFGNRLDYHYDTKGVIQRVDNVLGHFLEFNYGHCGFLEAITDHSNRKMHYHHDEDRAHLIRVIYPSTEEAPDGASPSYEYDVAESHGRLRHNIIRIRDENNAIKLVNTYGKDPSSFDFGRVVDQSFGCHQAGFRYTRLLTPMRLSTAINLEAVRVETIVDGEYKVLTFNFRGNLIDQRFRLAKDSSYRLYVESYRYDKRGNMSLAARPNGFIHHFTYDVDNPDHLAHGNLLEVQQEAPPTRPTMGRRIMRMRYESRYQLLVTQEDESLALTRYHYDHQTAPAQHGALVRIEHPQVTLPDASQQNAQSHFQFNSHGQIELETDSEGRVSAYEYTNGNLSAIVTDPAGLNIRREFDYDNRGNVVVHRDGEGHEVHFEFDVRNRLKRALKENLNGTQPEIQFNYYKTGQLAEHRRPAGEAEGVDEDYIVTHLEYDVLGRQTARTDAYGTETARRYQYCYDAWDRIDKVTDPLQRTDKHCYDERGRLLRLTRIAADASTQRVVQWIHDLNGQTSKVIQPDETQVEYKYDAWERPITVTETAYADGQVQTHYQYGKDDLLTTINVNGPDGHGNNNALLVSHSFDYDERGRLWKQNAGMGDVISWFDGEGLETRIIDPSGAVSIREFDAASRLHKFEDGIGNVISFNYDQANRLISQHYVEILLDGGTSVREEHRAYNAHNQQISYIDALNNQHQYQYDLGGRLVRTISPSGATETQTYNTFNEIIAVSHSLNGGMVQQSIVRDPIGRELSFTDDTGATTEFTYDDFDAITKRTHADGSVETLTYNTAGRLLQRQLPSGTNYDYSYRNDGQLETITISPSAGLIVTPDINFLRDGLGRLSASNQGTQQIQRHYDQAGRLSRESLNGNSFQHTHQDNTGSETLTFSDGREDLMHFDALGRLSTLRFQTAGSSGVASGLTSGDLIASYGYDGFSRPAQRHYFNGVESQFEYDSAQRLTGMSHQDPSADALASLTYGYNIDSRRNAINMTGDPWQDINISPDDYSRTQLVSTDLVSETFTLNGADSRQQRQSSEGGILTEHSYNTNSRHQIVTETITVGAAAPIVSPFIYSADGMCEQDSRHRYTYDALGLLREIRRISDGVLLLSLTWDPTQRLSSVQRPSGESIVLQPFGDRIYEEHHSPSGDVIQHSYGMMPEERVLRAGANLEWPVQDARSSTLLYSSELGDANSRIRYDSFGSPSFWNADGSALTGTSDLIMIGAFAGMHYLPDVGLYIAGSRIYDPETGLFLQPDSAGLFDSANPYVYCNHNPFDYMDSKGQWIESAWDVFSLGVGIASLSYNLTRDEIDWWSFGLDVVGIAADTVALILPGVPGGAGAAIKASRAAATGVDAVQQVTRMGRAVRYTQAAHGLANVGRGSYMSYEAGKEGHYGTAALGIGLSAIGLRGSLARFHTARVAGRMPDTLYSMQGDAAAILRSGRIWGETEGRVWSIPQLGASAARTGISRADMPPMESRLILEFSEGAQNIFKPHTVWGPFTAWKSFAGQHVTELGDVTLRKVSDATFDMNVMGYFARVTDAAHEPLSFINQSVMCARIRAMIPMGVDSMANLIPGLFASVLGLHAPLNDNSASQYSSNSHGSGVNNNTGGSSK